MTKLPALQKDEVATPPRKIIGSKTLPWPDKRLSPNARVHWRTKAAATRRARRVTAKLCAAAGLRRDLCPSLTDKTRVPLALSFYAPDRRRRDDDNLIAAFKPYRDELAAVLGIDDWGFVPTYGFECPSKQFPKGAVHITVERHP